MCTAVICTGVLCTANIYTGALCTEDIILHFCIAYSGHLHCSSCTADIYAAVLCTADIYTGALCTGCLGHAVLVAWSPIYATRVRFMHESCWPRPAEQSSEELIFYQMQLPQDQT